MPKSEPTGRDGGESNVTLQTLKILADTLGCRIVDLVKGL